MMYIFKNVVMGWARGRNQKQDLTIYWKERSDSAYDTIVYDQVETRLSESQTEAEALNQSKSVGMDIVTGLYPSATLSNSHNLVLTRS